MTSGNRSGEPIVTDDTEALTRLAGLADAWLTHDRPIACLCDDSLLRVRPDGTAQVRGRPAAMSPARPASRSRSVPPSTTGGDLKNALCLGEADQAWFGPHIGDMADLAALEAAARAELAPHPASPESPPAGGRRPPPRLPLDPPGTRPGRPARPRQAGCWSSTTTPTSPPRWPEHGLDGGTPVIGVAFDGTGYGDDGTVWGGEILLADYTGYRRLASAWPPAPPPGGDAGVANPAARPWPGAWAAGLPWAPQLPSRAGLHGNGTRPLAPPALTRQLACVPTSSMGRLFDAVSSLVGRNATAPDTRRRRRWSWRRRRGRRGDADAAAYPFGFTADGREMDPAPALRAPPGRPGPPHPRPGPGRPLSTGAFARAVADARRRARTETGRTTVALTGGVFANALLEEETAALLAGAGFTVLRHGEVPRTTAVWRSVS